MTVSTTQFTTGPSTLPDVGVLFYNGCVFSPLFETSISGTAVKDEARRTVKCMDYMLTVDGYVTLPTGADSINGAMSRLRDLLTKQGGNLVYKGRGFDLSIGPGPVSRATDVAWGPIPELIEFQPLGGGRSAKVKWQVRTSVLETESSVSVLRTGSKLVKTPLLQFNYETSVTYDEAGYSTLTIRGILEIPLTRNPSQKTRTLTYTADDYRAAIDSRIADGIDLSRFHITRRDFHVSRDKRTLEWEFTAEEKPYMDIPPECTMARGTYSVRPANAGMGLCLWLCTLRATYTVRADRPRRIAWFAFLALLRERMKQSALAPPLPPDGEQNPPLRTLPQRAFFRTVVTFAAAGLGPTHWPLFFSAQSKKVKDSRNAWLVDFSFDEGVYLDSKTVSFSATWRLVTVFSHILLASGLWRKIPEVDAHGDNLWAASVRDISGSESWLSNNLDPKMDVIVDFGGG